ncbi:MAG TPA: hypothetical protein VF021_05765, partial [Longimicrobiales bacterium]
MIRLRLAALAGTLITLAVFAQRRRLAGFLDALARSAASSLSALWHGLGRLLAMESRLHLAALGSIILVAFLARLEFLFQPMRYDETITYINFALPPWYIAVTTYTAPNTHVFHSLLVHLAT